MSWPTAGLGEVCDIVSGATPKTGVGEYWDGDIAWTTPKDLSDLDAKYLSDTPRKLTESGLASCSASMLPVNSVLLSSRAPIGLVAINSIPLCTNQGFKNLIPHKERLDPEYLYWWLKSHNRELQSLGRGATFKEVSKAIVSRIQIPLPPLAEQKRIAGILDAADALRAKRRESIGQLDRLIQATFLEMFGDPVTNPKGWPTATLPEVSVVFRDGPFGSNLKTSHYADSGIRVLRLQNIGVGDLLDDDLAFVSKIHYDSLPKHHCKPRDIIIGTMGDPNLRACVLPDSLHDSLNKADCILLRPNLTKLLPDYGCWLLNSPSLVQKAMRLVRGQTRGRISKGRLSALTVPIPDIESQEIFARSVVTIFSLRQNHNAHANQIDSLFASLQSRAFRGEL